MKAQAALEFLTTYGWAFIVILTALGALAYFGVFNIDPPDKCVIGPEMTCVDYIISKPAGSPASMTLVISNSKEFMMKISHGSCNWPNGDEADGGFHVELLADGPTATNNETENWLPGEKRYFLCPDQDNTDHGLVEGDKAKVQFSITYANQDIDGFEHTIQGEVVGTVNG